MKTYTYENPRPLAWTICTLTALFGLLTLVKCGLLAYFSVLLSRLIADEPGAQAALYHAGTMLGIKLIVLGVFMGLIFIVNAILFLVWLYRAAANNLALGARGLDYTPGWCVGWFFIPVANLVMPYLAVKEVWQTSHGPGERSVSAGHAPVLAWWVLRIASAIILMISSIVSDSKSQSSTLLYSASFDAPGMRASTIVNVVGLALEVVAIVLFIHIVWRISQRQARHARSAPPPGLRADAAPPVLNA